MRQRPDKNRCSNEVLNKGSHNLSEPKIGEVYVYRESPLELLVKLIAYRSEKIDNSDMGNMTYWKWETLAIYDQGHFDPPVIGEQFEVSTRERGPSYCWHAWRLDPQPAVAKPTATPTVDAKELADSLSCRPVDHGFEF